MSAEPPVLYLALGDSYTIGTGASAERNNFPTLLARHLADATGRLVQVTNPAVNGYTADDLIREELTHLKRARPDYITVLIGANDVHRGRTLQEFRSSIQWIYDVVAGAAPDRSRVACISIPDWSIAETARRYGPLDITRMRIETFNSTCREEALSRSFQWVDITPLSRSEQGSEGWISADGMHPSDRQYRLWADHIWKQLAPTWGARG